MKASYAHKLFNKLKAWGKDYSVNPFPKSTEAYRVFNQLIAEAKK